MKRKLRVQWRTEGKDAMFGTIIKLMKLNIHVMTDASHRQHIQYIITTIK